ncbi:MAG: hypothetical protein Q8K98_07465 [Bacteroidota bacterium]|nr:hypothetical protein [Bacteroidota bacterium]
MNKNIILTLILITSLLWGCKNAPVSTTGNTQTDNQIILFHNSPGPDFRNDHVLIDSARISGDTLILVVSYSGGCREHEFKLFGSYSIIKTNPPQAEIYLSHNSNADMCEAWITENVKFDLSPLKNYYLQTFDNTGPLLLRIYEPGTNRVYEPLVRYDF